MLYQWLSLTDGAGRSFCRAVAFRELTYLPIATRGEPDMLGKQWAALRGLYNAGADFCYSALGAFQPERLGVADDELLSQQGENLLRGLARSNEDFVFLVTAAFVDRPALTSAMVKMAQVDQPGRVAAARHGKAVGAGFSTAIGLPGDAAGHRHRLLPAGA